MVKCFRRVYSEIRWHTEIVKFKYFLWVLNKKRFCTEYIRSSHGHHPGDHTINLPGFLLFWYDSSLDIFTIYQSFLKNSLNKKIFYELKVIYTFSKFIRKHLDSIVCSEMHTETGKEPHPRPMFWSCVFVFGAYERRFRFQCLFWNAHWNLKRASCKVCVLVVFFHFWSSWENI